MCVINVSLYISTNALNLSVIRTVRVIEVHSWIDDLYEFMTK